MKNEKVFPSWPHYTEDEAKAVYDVLLSNKVNYWTGSLGKDFEQKFSKWTGVSFSIAQANGTLALELSLNALHIGPGDEVIVTPRSFIASVSCVVKVGATPIFADVEPDSGNISANTIENVISERTKAIICVHHAGWPCEMGDILALAKKYNILVVEDCAQAHGAQYRGSSVGSIGDVSAWSFCQDKIITTGGEGGMVTTNNEELYQTMWSYKDHGKSMKKVFSINHSPGYRWVHDDFGTNLRMTEMQAAIGILQLSKINEWHALRRQNASRLAEILINNTTLSVPMPPDYLEHAWYRFYAYVIPNKLKRGWDRDRIMLELNARGVPCTVGSCPELYRENAFFKHKIGPPNILPVAHALGKTSLAFMVHPTITLQNIEEMGHIICDVLDLASN